VFAVLATTACTPTTPEAAPAPTAPTPTPARTVVSHAPSVPSYESLENIYLLHNKLYSAGQMPAVSCRLPDSQMQTRKDVQQYSTAVLACLERAWKPVVEQADVVYEPTKVYAVDNSDRTGCGPFGDDADALYCDDNTDIYVSWQNHVVNEDFDKVWAQTY